MVCVQDIGDIKGLGGLLARLLSGIKVNEVSGFREVLTDRRQIEALAGTVVVGYNSADLGADLHGDLTVGFVVGLANLGSLVVEAKH